MADVADHTVAAADEGRHEPGDEELWGESYYLDFVSESGDLAGYTRIGVYPNLGVTWWTTSVVGDGRPLVSSIDHRLPLEAAPRGSTGTVMAARSADDLSVEYVARQPLRSMSVRGRAPARVLDRPSDVYRGTAGSACSLELDLTWTTDGSPYHYDVTTRYEIPCLVRGELRIGDEHVEVQGQGQRDHSWGVRDWWAIAWCWAAARLDDGTRVHWADIRLSPTSVGLGYVQRGGQTRPVTSLDVDETLDQDGLPERARARVEPGDLHLEIEPRRFAPALLVAPDGRLSRFPRAVARFHAEDGRRGAGWIEWNQPPPPGGG